MQGNNSFCCFIPYHLLDLLRQVYSFWQHGCRSLSFLCQNGPIVLALCEYHIHSQLNGWRNYGKVWIVAFLVIFADEMPFAMWLGKDDAFEQCFLWYHMIVNRKEKPRTTPILCRHLDIFYLGHMATALLKCYSVDHLHSISLLILNASSIPRWQSSEAMSDDLYFPSRTWLLCIASGNQYLLFEAEHIQ